MKVLVTGAKGFIGKHMVILLKRRGHEVFEYDLGNTDEELNAFIKESDFVIHLAGINRPLTVEEFYEGNSNFTKHLVDLIKKNNRNDLPLIMSSSIQAELDNDYGKSKKMGEDFLLASGLPTYIYRLYNAFGKWGRANYNSACATFCYNIAHDLPIQIRDREYVVSYNYVDDICEEFLRKVEGDHKGSKGILYVQPIYKCSLGKLADLLYYFKKEVESDRHLPILHDEFELKLFKTFCNYLSEEEYQYNMNYASDNRGSFEELYKSKKWGQISDNVSFPGITKGGHYHTYKKEIFYTVIGKCEIVQRDVKTDKMITDVVEGNNPHPVDIKVGYTHQITNVGEIDSHTIMWISQIYHPDTSDTFYEPVIKNVQ